MNFIHKNAGSLLLVLLALVTGCQKKEFDAYYSRPDNLAQPIYQQLQSRGNFKHLLALIDKAGYKTTLNTAGYWTLFAPNDEAFEAYLKTRGIQSIENISADSATALVQYALVYNAFKAQTLGDYQSNAGWVTSAAYKRRTAYYDFVYTENNRKLIAANRNGSYVSSDNNNKYLPYFVSSYFNTQKLSSDDYAYFYPGVTYTGFNVAGAKVVNKDIVAENGVIHETDKVISPLPSLDQYLASHPEYSEFKKIYDQFLVTYTANSEITARYRALTQSPDQVYVKNYSSTLAFSPNNENFLKLQDNDGQSDGYTLFIPTNEVLLNYEQNVLLRYYPVKSLSQLPIGIVTDFLNAHMWKTTVWPSKFATTLNYHGEAARFTSTDIVDKQVLSNGIFYGTSKVQEANVFHSVYGHAYLNPGYSLLTRALDLELKLVVSNPNLRFALCLLSDATLTQAGFAWNTANSTFQYTAPGGSTVIGADAVNRLKRLLNLHIIAYAGNTAPDFSGEGIIETYDGEYIRYNQNKLFAAGSAETGIVIDSFKTASNGTGYYLHNLLNFSEQNIGKDIEKYATKSSDPYYRFFQYLKSSPLYTAATGAIQGVSAGNFYTVFIPSNAAIQTAIDQGWLPSSTAPSTSEDIDKVSRFIQYHILNKNTVVPDGQKTGSFETLLKNSSGDAVSVRISGQAGSLQITDARHASPNANLVTAYSNVLSNRAVVHQIDQFLQYQY
ncbi:fasciclin domain-containing protein [Filimonas effusa]|uniref:FAS1 domain-containing protein n=1 Tax=Filimonas effusa TaxID=2508721 RepID=A0A4Q1DA67_9BACT|nr:fasciclin domain-containing protein [Filimonas effusa]RXK86284.1 hypothetical protein ESB13_05615 [Filimonas effusa]